MTTKTKFRTALTALAVSLTAFTGAAAAADGAETKVKIKAESNGFFGYVKSESPACADGRTVTLFKQEGSVQDPRNDTKIGSDTTQANGAKYMWSTGNTGVQGNFYARAAKTPGCKAATSKTIASQR